MLSLSTLCSRSPGRLLPVLGVGTGPEDRDGAGADGRVSKLEIQGTRGRGSCGRAAVGEDAGRDAQGHRCDRRQLSQRCLSCMTSLYTLVSCNMLRTMYSEATGLMSMKAASRQLCASAPGIGRDAPRFRSPFARCQAESMAATVCVRQLCCIARNAPLKGTSPADLIVAPSSTSEVSLRPLLPFPQTPLSTLLSPFHLLSFAPSDLPSR